MRGVDLHPEELIEREALGELSSDERDRLQAHLDVCAVCRFEVRTRQDVRAELEEAEEVDVQRLLSTVLTPEAARSRRTWRQAARHRARGSRALLLAAALLTIASAAAAAGWPQFRKALWHRSPSTEVTDEAPRAPSLTPVAPHGGVPARASEPDPDRDPSLVSAPRAQPALAPAPSHTLPPAAALALTPPAAQEPGPDSLFDRANKAHHSGERARAVQGYRDLIARYPASPEAHEALAALGKMLLDGGDGVGALRCFDEYLRAGGPLRQDVMADRALALQRLGRPSDEMAAWSALVASYPASVHAERARRRLTELEKP